jgi:hypothetical protein
MRRGPKIKLVRYNRKSIFLAKVGLTTKLEL